MISITPAARPAARRHSYGSITQGHALDALPRKHVCIITTEYGKPLYEYLDA